MSILRAILAMTAITASTTSETAPPAFWSWAETPPMGWNSWDCFGTGVTEEQTKANADYMVEHLKAFGWDYVVVDIQWYETSSKGFDYTPTPKPHLDTHGRLLPAPAKFPSAANGAGFKPLADDVHARGLKFGVHLMRGIPKRAVKENLPILGTNVRATDIADTSSTCPWNPDMYGVDMSKPGAQAYYDSVFALLADWGVDFVKVDDLTRPYHQAEVIAIRKAIDKTGRPMVFSTSPGETPLAAAGHVERHANMWRVSDDFWDDWRALKAQFKRMHDWTIARGPGHFPDADMLPIGNVRAMTPNGWTHFTQAEQRTLMSLWAIARSPLMMGGHLPKNDAFTLSLLTNRDVIGVNQHSTNNRQLSRDDDSVVWCADVPGSNDKYVALFNISDVGLDVGQALYDSALINQQTPGHGRAIQVPIKGARELHLVVLDGGDGIQGDHANWGEPTLTGPAGKLKLTDLKPRSATCGWRSVQFGKSVAGRPMKIGDTAMTFGIGTHANSTIVYDIPEGYDTLTAVVGIDRGGADEGAGRSDWATVQMLVFDRDPPVRADKGEIDVTAKLADLGLTGPVTVRNLWDGSTRDVHGDTLIMRLAPHDAALLRVSPRAR
jgi:hypothetical protein